MARLASKQILDDLLESGCSQKELLVIMEAVSLNVATCQKGLNVCDNGRVAVYSCKPRRVVCEVKGSGSMGPYLVLNSYCTCPYFRKRVLTGEDWYCKHQIAAKVAIVFQEHIEQTPEDYTALIRRHFCDKKKPQFSMDPAIKFGREAKNNNTFLEAHG
eukprot:GEMP01077671.1.p2 GENE.GEMP01077671.1~~GEMP01077671.1.p2  ORF type:complete len:159 (+),score=13.40 GEMP01077671.1:98-574(+)